MIKRFKIILPASIVMLLSSLALVSCSKEKTMTVVQFDEREKGIDPYQVRYLFADHVVRIDDNNDKGNYVIYDDKKRMIYSVNHDDSTVLEIKNSEWEVPKFGFERNVSWKLLEGAPAVDSKPVYSYYLSADETVCSEAQVVEGFLLAESHLLKRYRQTLSAGQAESIEATPEELRTPCLLIDSVYNTGSVYDKGFPLQQWHLNGLQRIMTSYKTDEKYNAKLFELPKDYKHYSMGDNLSFGAP